MSGTEYHEHYGIVGDCAACGGQMIETTCLETDEERRATLECQDCGVEAELRHDFEEGLEGGSWSGVGDPEFKPLNWIQCPRCYGHGYVEDPICDLRRAMNGREHPCPDCNTSGRVARVVETDGGRCGGGTGHLKNPMRWSIRHRQVNLSGFPVEVTEIDIRPDEGNIYQHARILD
jgi:hypothetical protein